MGLFDTKKNTIDNAEQALMAQKRSFQDWLPIEDVDRGFIKAKNWSRDEYYPVITFGDVNIDLMTEKELFIFAKNIETVLDSINVSDFQILIMPVPYDIEVWLKHVDSRIDQLNADKSAIDRKIRDAQMNGDERADLNTLNADHSSIDFYIAHLRGQKNYVMSKLSDGTIISKKAFFIPSFDNLTDLSEYQEATNTVVQRFSEVIPGTRQCNSQEIRNMLFTILNPLHAKYVKVPAAQLPPRTNFSK